MQRKELLIHIVTWMNHKVCWLKESRSKMNVYVWYYLYKIIEMENQCIMTEGRSVVAWGVEEGLQRIWENLLEWWKGSLTWFSSVQFSQSIVSNSLWPHGLQNTRLPCLSPTPGAYSNSCPSSRWCHPTISSSVVPFSSHLQSFPASGSFPVSQFFKSGGQSIGVSASASVLPMNIQDWFPLGWTGWISLQSKELSRVFSSTTVRKHQFFVGQLSL